MPTVTCSSAITQDIDHIYLYPLASPSLWVLHAFRHYSAVVCSFWCPASTVLMSGDLNAVRRLRPWLSSSCLIESIKSFLGLKILDASAALSEAKSYRSISYTAVTRRNCETH